MVVLIWLRWSRCSCAFPFSPKTTMELSLPSTKETRAAWSRTMSIWRRTHKAPHVERLSAPSCPVTFNEARTYLQTVLLIPPHRPLSVVMGTTMFFSTSAAAQRMCLSVAVSASLQVMHRNERQVLVSVPGWSPSSFSSGYVMPRDASVANWATRIFDAATIFMADVIFWMFCTDRMRCFTARNRDDADCIDDTVGGACSNDKSDCSQRQR